MYYSLRLDLGGGGRAFDLVEPRAQQVAPVNACQLFWAF
jgi:hypothetical protein